MRNNQVHSVLSKKYNQDIADKVLDSYLEIETNYFLEKWKPSELDAGHFVESVRRIIELELTGNFTPFSSQLSSFSDNILKQYEQQQGDESFRILIPRMLKSVYNIRNKRGVGHIKDIIPNEMDATVILYSVKWVLAEIIRLATNLSTLETQKLLDSIIERNIDILWKENNLKRVLNPKITAKEQILILLYDESPLPVSELQKIIEYKHTSNFVTIIKRLHKDRILEYKSTGECILSPLGTKEAEIIIKKYKK